MLDVPGKGDWIVERFSLLRAMHRTPVSHVPGGRSARGPIGLSKRRWAVDRRPVKGHDADADASRMGLIRHRPRLAPPKSIRAARSCSVGMEGVGSVRRLIVIGVLLFALGAACSSDGDGGSSPGSTEASAGAPSADGGSSSVTVPDAFTAVTVEVLGAPTFPFPGTDGQYHVSYDLQLVNTSAQVPATIERMDVVDAGNPDAVLVSIEGDQFVDPDCEVGDCNRLRMLPSAPADDVVIAPQEGRVLFVDVSFDTIDDVPDEVLHHLYIQGSDSPSATAPVALDYLTTPYEINSGELQVVGPPVAGDNWVAMNGCCLIGFGHRSSPNSVNGKIVNGQHFAIDWKRMNDDGAFFTGDPNDNENYVDYGAGILAVADGEVVAVLDGMEANRPGVLPAADPELAQTVTIETVDGNHIVLDLGNGTYAFYAHLQAGTILVEEGDTVERGEKIAELGNTGNANASHLHFHIMDGPSVLGSNGIPYVIDSFEYAGEVDIQEVLDADDFLTGTFNQGELADPEERTDQLPMVLDIIDFPVAGD